MLKRRYKKWIISGAYVLVLGSILLCVTMLINGINNYFKGSINYDYGIYGVFEDLKPVVEEVNKSIIIKPYISDAVTIGKYFYDYEADKEEQINSLVYFEKTYMQNSGIDYISDNTFDVVAILDGEIISIKKDELMGNTIQVKHDKNLISVYQSVDNVKVKEGDKINQGTILATSGTNKINTNYNNLLHFEIFYKGEVLDPENIYNLNIEDFN